MGKIGRIPAGVRHVPRLQRQTPPSTSAAVLDKDTSHLVIGPIGNIGQHLIQQLANMGAGTIVAVSRYPGSTTGQVIPNPILERHKTRHCRRRCGG